MDTKKKAKLESGGWRIGTADDFLELTSEEAAYVELKLALSTELRERRTENGLSQVELAKKLGSSQSRVAKMEASDPSVSLDLLVRGLFATGASQKDIAAAIGRRSPKGAVKSRTRGAA